MITRVRARIFGRVQGVGFRPTVYRYATEFRLAGFVCNTAEGVMLEVEGDESTVDAFFRHLTQHPPRQAVIVDIQQETCTERGYADFRVVESNPEGEAAAQISPDLATCDDCLAELFDPQDRRHRYPFINCTNCGPRFTILRDLPYDRDKTSMADFALCHSCDAEYHDPSDRRFHAEPNACEDCGPRLQFIVSAGDVAAAVHGGKGLDSPGETDAAALARTAALLRRGRLVAIKGLGGYQVACDAGNPESVTRLRQRKHRPSKPFAVMFRDVATVKRCCQLSEAEEAELLSPERPIVLLKRRPLALGISKCVSPDTDTVGALLPCTPLHHLLMQEFDALVMTSGNLSDEPIISDEAELPTLLGPIADAALTHNRPILHKCDDSVVRMFNGQRQFVRRARGFVPSPIRIAAQSPQILAVGGELKNTFCLVRDGNALLSQHIGDLKDYRTYESFGREIDAWRRLMRVEPEIIAHDLHPAYLSTKFALKLCGSRPAMAGTVIPPGQVGDTSDNTVAAGFSLRGKDAPVSRVGRDAAEVCGNGAATEESVLLGALRLIGVQHHHAHIASVLAEHDLREPVIGVALDGTGYGTDGTIWGGEILVANRCDFERVAHFKPYRLPGGDKAVEEPWRMATSVLLAEGLSEQTHTRAGGRGPAWNEAPSMQQMIEAGFNSPLTSSAGRLFDAVAALLGLCDVAAYEAQGAIRLEAIADPRVTESYPFEIVVRKPSWILDFGPAIHAIVADRKRGEAVGQIAARFHNTIAAAVVRVCGRVRDQRGLHMVALSGGVFQNELLLRRTVEALRAQRFTVFTNTAVPPNDGGLALGQAAVALARIEAGKNGSTTVALSAKKCAPGVTREESSCA
jgi:hydrogenase maturation protein HypF